MCGTAQAHNEKRAQRWFFDGIGGSGLVFSIIDLTGGRKPRYDAVNAQYSDFVGNAYQRGYPAVTVILSDIGPVYTTQTMDVWDWEDRAKKVVEEERPAIDKALLKPRALALGYMGGERTCSCGQLNCPGMKKFLPLRQFQEALLEKAARYGMDITVLFEPDSDDRVLAQQAKDKLEQAKAEAEANQPDFLEMIGSLDQMAAALFGANRM